MFKTIALTALIASASLTAVTVQAAIMSEADQLDLVEHALCLQGFSKADEAETAQKAAKSLEWLNAQIDNNDWSEARDLIDEYAAEVDASISNKASTLELKVFAEKNSCDFWEATAEEALAKAL